MKSTSTLDAFRLTVPASSSRQFITELSSSEEARRYRVDSTDCCAVTLDGCEYVFDINDDDSLALEHVSPPNAPSQTAEMQAVSHLVAEGSYLRYVDGTTTFTAFFTGCGMDVYESPSPAV